MIRRLILAWMLAVVAMTPAAAQQDRGARALALRAQSSAASRPPRLSLISNGEQWYGVGLTVGDITMPPVVRVLHRNLANCTVSGVRMLAGNYANANTTSGSVPANTTAAPKERQNPGTITFHTSLEFAGTKTSQSQPRTPVLWGGQFLATLGPSAASYAFVNLRLSDTVTATVPPGATIYERSQATTAANGQLLFSAISLRGGTTGFGTDSGEGLNQGSTQDRVWDGQSDITVSSAQFVGGWSNLAMLGYCSDGTVAPSIAIAGDSIVTKVDDAGYGYFTGGWALRAFASYPHMLLSLPGEREFDAIVRWNYASRFEASKYATHILWAYGRNDLSYDMGTGGLTATQTLAAMQVVRLQAAKAFMLPRTDAPGQVFIGSTILPAPTSSDGFKTYAGQTKDVYEAGRVLFNQWMRDPSAAGFVAQANAQVAGVPGAGTARVADPCVGLEVNASGVPALNGGYSPIVTTTYATGTSSGSNTSNTFNDTTKAWTPGQYRGAELRIVSGTGAGLYRSIGGNSATQLLIADTWTTTPDATSVYEITDAPGWNGVHPGTRGAILAASGIPAATLMVPLPVKTSAIDPRDLPHAADDNGVNSDRVAG